jgi:hypothetical protein
MKKYQLAPHDFVKRDDGAYIPPDPNNVDYFEYLQWVAEGNEPDPLPPQSE